MTNFPRFVTILLWGNKIVGICDISYDYFTLKTINNYMNNEFLNHVKIRSNSEFYHFYFDPRNRYLWTQEFDKKNVLGWIRKKWWYFILSNLNRFKMSVVVCFSFLGFGNFNFGLKDKYYLNQEFGFIFPGGAKMETNISLSFLKIKNLKNMTWSMNIIIYLIISGPLV